MTIHAGPIVAQRDGLTVIACTACGWAHLDPLPDPAALDAYYASEFWQKTKAGWREQYEAQRDWLAMRHGDWLTVLEPHTSGRQLLDVGSGWGHFMADAQVRGWNAWGIEPSTEAFTYTLDNWERWRGGGGQYNGGWETYDVLMRFDAITAFWLLEHVPDPVAFLRWARGLLAPGGALMLAVPQEWTALQSTANEQAAVKNFQLHETHLHYWTRETITRLLANCGFRVVDALATYPMEKFILAGYDYTADATVGAKCHADVRSVELYRTHSERLSWGHYWAEQETGRDLIVVCKPYG